MRRCDGDGRVLVRRRVPVRVPGGVFHGSVLKVGGCGHVGKWGGAAGDLLLHFHVRDALPVCLPRKGGECSFLIRAVYQGCVSLISSACRSVHTGT
jgi:hypothetical protein